MIKINLVKKKRASGGATGITLTNLTSLNELKKIDLKNLLNFFRREAKNESDEQKKFDLNGPIPKLILAAALCWFVDDTITGYKQAALGVVQNEMGDIEKQKNAVQLKLGKIKGYETIKKQLEEDELAVRTKYEVVSKLLENRSGPAKMLMQVAQSIPSEVWLTDLKVNETSVKIMGATPGYNQVSAFIESLKSTSQFGEIGLSGIQESTSVTKDQRFQTFELSASRRAVN